MSEEKICEEALMLTGTSPGMYSNHCWAKKKIRAHKNDIRPLLKKIAGYYFQLCFFIYLFS